MPLSRQFVPAPDADAGPSTTATATSRRRGRLIAKDGLSPGDPFATPRGGVLAEYDRLKTSYSGYEANYNTTTRLRGYVGEAGVRPLIYDYTEPLLVAHEPNRVRMVSDGSTVRWWNNRRLVFDYVDTAPYTSGHVAFRTTWSQFRIEGFRVRRPAGRR